MGGVSIHTFKALKKHNRKHQATQSYKEKSKLHLLTAMCHSMQSGHCQGKCLLKWPLNKINESQGETVAKVCSGIKKVFHSCGERSNCT